MKDGIELRDMIDPKVTDWAYNHGYPWRRWFFMEWNGRFWFPMFDGEKPAPTFRSEEAAMNWIKDK